MEKHTPSPILSTPASLWDGTRQLPGTLEIWEGEVVFRQQAFLGSHLNLVISLSEIEKVEEYLVFDLARNGLQIWSKSGQADLFVLDEARLFKKKLLEQVALLDGR